MHDDDHWATVYDDDKGDGEHIKFGRGGGEFICFELSKWEEAQVLIGETIAKWRELQDGQHS